MSVPIVPAFRALVVEDHQFQRHVAAQFMTECGATEVILAENGADAIAQLDMRETPIDIILCDLSMPKMDGLEFLRHVADRYPDVSVILASAMDAPILRAAEMMARSYGVRVAGATVKPLAPARLRPLILNHFHLRAVVKRPPVERMSIAEIREGIARDEFEPFFQPKVFLSNSALAGVEALMRWRHPTRGLVPPAAFIPVMEEADVISEVTFLLLRKSIKVACDWRERGLLTKIALNFSVNSLTDTALPDRLCAMVAEADLAPENFIIEVTETVAMTDLGHSLETLARLRMKGFGLSIDDYGTGFSSMQQLARVPFSEIKIDQVFVTGCGQQEVLQALLATSVTMARRLELRSVAEGVETEQDWRTVARLGCDVAQGFLIAKPMPGDEVIDWYVDWMESRKTSPLSLRGAE